MALTAASPLPRVKHWPAKELFDFADVEAGVSRSRGRSPSSLNDQIGLAEWSLPIGDDACAPSPWWWRTSNAR